MAIAPFTYHRPHTLLEACELGRSLGAESRYLAGGTELLLDLRLQRFTCSHLISLRDVEGLRGIAASGEGLRIGACTTLEDVAHSPEVAAHAPALAETVRMMSARAIRNTATIGGNFGGAVACADTPPICIVMGGVLLITGTGGERQVPAGAFIVEPRRSVLEPGEILTAILIPPQPPGSGAAYERFALRKGQALPVASAAARVVLDEGRVADAGVVLGAVGPVPIQVEGAAALRGKALEDDLLETVARSAGEAARPITDIRGSAAYRRDLVVTLTRRALTRAAKRAGRLAGSAS